MDRFTPFCPPFNYIESNLSSLIHSLLASRSFHDSSFGPLPILSPFLYDSSPPPLHPYTRTSSSFSAVVQLYARSGQLPTNLTLAKRFHSGSPFCRYGCRSLEDAHHLFVHCPAFDALRDEASKSLREDTERVLTQQSFTPSVTSHLEHAVTHLFQDDPSWPLHSSRFYLGLLPPLLPSPMTLDSAPGESRRPLLRLAHSCHSSSIRLAARIWGSALRHYLSSTAKPGPRQPLSTASLLLKSNLSLPTHLQYLLHI
jgi:hypothetical protein